MPNSFEAQLSLGVTSKNIWHYARELGIAKNTAFGELSSIARELERRKLCNSAADFTGCKTTALRCLGYSDANVPIYLKYYTPKEQNDATANHYGPGGSSFLSSSIAELFSKASTGNFRRQHSDAAGKNKKKIKRRKLNTEPWIQLYAPKHFTDLSTDAQCNLALLDWLFSWRCCKNIKKNEYDPDNRIVLLAGQHGSGKTCLVNIVADHCGFNLVNLSAAELPVATIMNQVRAIVTTNTVGSRPSLCLIELADTQDVHSLVANIVSLANKKDAAGNSLIKRPIICTCTDLYSRTLFELRKICKIIELKSQDMDEIQHRLDSILEDQGIFIDPDVICRVIKRFRGDFRSIINAIELVSKHSLDELPQHVLDNDIQVTPLIQLVFTQSYDSFACFLPKLKPCLHSQVSQFGLHTCAALLAENASLLPVSICNAMTRVGFFHELLVCADMGGHATGLEFLTVACGFLVKYLRGTRKPSRLMYPGMLSMTQHWSKIQKNKHVITMLRENSKLSGSSAVHCCAFAVDTLPFILDRIHAVLENIGHRFVADISSMALADACILPFATAFASTRDLDIILLGCLLLVFGIHIKTDSHSQFDPPVLNFDLQNNALESLHRGSHGNKGGSHVALLQLQKMMHRLSSLQCVHLMTDMHRTLGYGNSIVDVFRAIDVCGYRNWKNDLDEKIKSSVYAGDDKATNDNDTKIRVAGVLDASLLCPALCDTAPSIATLLQLINAESQYVQNIIVNGDNFVKATKTCGAFKYQDQNCSAVRYTLKCLD